MIILGIIVIGFLIAAVYLGRPVYHLGKGPSPKQQKPAPETVSISNESNTTRNSFWGWGFSLIMVLILFLLAPWASKEYMKNMSSVEIGKKIAEISSQLSRCGDFLPEEKRAEVEGDLKKIQEMAENKDLSSEKVMLFANSLITKHQSDLQKAIGLEKIRQKAERQDAAERAEKAAEEKRILDRGMEVILKPVEDNGRYRQYRLPVDTQLGDSFVLKEAIASRGFLNVFVGNTKKGEYPKKVIPAKTIVKIDEYCNRNSDGSFYLSLNSDYDILTNSNIVVYHKKGDA